MNYYSYDLSNKSAKITEQARMNKKEIRSVFRTLECLDRGGGLLGGGVVLV